LPMLFFLNLGMPYIYISLTDAYMLSDLVRLKVKLDFKVKVNTSNEEVEAL